MSKSRLNVIGPGFLSFIQVELSYNAINVLVYADCSYGWRSSIKKVDRANKGTAQDLYQR